MKIYKVKVNGKVYEVELEAVDEVKGSVEAKTVSEEAPAKEAASEGANQILAPIAGKVLDIKVKPGEMVRKGQTVAIIEAMKLENEIQSAYSGKVKEVVVSEGADVRNKDVLIVLE
ncbi:MAG: biotin/lipoyl-binding protein [Erysipelotrichaceae bacterium]|nr:biotin/lipoyl-binding protein [Erysipelotrichaceae bacterium]MBQ6493200.1 biotin/lipoyl-binding protein [Erysipelotrichaceae bacterium]